MKKWALLMIMMIMSISVIVIGCEIKESTKEEVYEEFHKKITTMSSYSCIAKVEIWSNKSQSEYTFIHEHKKPSYYKLEIVEPEELKGKIIEYTDKNINIKNPDIDDLITLPNTTPNNQYLFIGDFISNYINNEEVEISLLDDNLIIKTPISGNSKYFSTETLYVDSKTKNPKYLEILDKEGNVKIKVTYEEVKFIK